jgi:hypothetical protein
MAICSHLEAIMVSHRTSFLLLAAEWTITRRAVAEYGGNKSRAAKVLRRTYRWLRKLESEMTGPQSRGHNPSNKS